MKDLVCDNDVIHKEAVDYVMKNSDDVKRLAKLSQLFKVLGDETRVRILSSLNHKELCVHDLAYVLNMTQSAISHQLKTLKLANLVKNRRDGKTIYYSIADNHVNLIFNQGLEHIDEKNNL